MALNIPVFYGSYRRDRKGIRLARYIVSRLEARGDRPLPDVQPVLVQAAPIDRRTLKFTVSRASDFSSSVDVRDFAPAKMVFRFKF